MFGEKISRLIELTVEYCWKITFYTSVGGVATICRWAEQICNFPMSCFFRMLFTKNYWNRLFFCWVINKHGVVSLGHIVDTKWWRQIFMKTWVNTIHFYFYYLQWRMPPFMCQCWGLQVGPMHETAGMGKLINAALLSLLMRRVWVYAVLPSSWVNSSFPLVCRHDRVTREVGRVGLVGRDRGRRGYWMALYLYIYTARLLMSVFL